MLPKTYLKFLYGDVIEQLMILLVKEAGHTVTDEQLEIELDGIKGHIDCKIDGIVTDVKSASPYSFKKFKSGSVFTDDPFGYIGQISGYSNVLTPGQSPCFLAFDKVHGDIHLLSVPTNLTAQHSPSERIAHQKEVIAGPKPERCYPEEDDGKSGNKKLGINCGYCEYRFDCWSDKNDGKGIRTFIYANGPRFLTEVVRTPDVPELGVEVDPNDENIVPF